MKEMKQNSKDNVNLENNNESRKENNLFTEMFEKIDKKNVLIGCLIVVIIISAIFMILNNESEISENNSGYEEKIPITRHNVKIHIDFTENREEAEFVISDKDGADLTPFDNENIIKYL